jgi:hypothetical protein
MARGKNTAHDPRRKVGRNVFDSPPSLNDRAAPLGIGDKLRLSKSQTNEAGKKKIEKSADETLSMGMPVPPPSGWPTVGEVKSEGSYAFMDTALRSTVGGRMIPDTPFSELRKDIKVNTVKLAGDLYDESTKRTHHDKTPGFEESLARGIEKGLKNAQVTRKKKEKLDGK